MIELMMLSCSRNNSIEEMLPETNVRFGVDMYTPRSLIKIPSSMQSFSVWAWRKQDLSALKEPVFDGDVVTYDISLSLWTYNYPRSWHMNNIYNFYALYPDTLSSAYFNDRGNLSIPYLDIRQTEEYNSADIVDLMKAVQYVDVGMNPPEMVNLTFSHMLTNVNIDLKKHENNAKDTMEVTYILLNGMNCVGSMEDDVWSLSEPSYFWDKLDTPQTLSANASPCFSNVLMLPQDIKKNQVALYVVYSYQQAGGTAMTKMLETSLPAGEWKAGEKIVYTGTIQVDNSIVFDTPQVESWGTEQVGGTIIIQ